MKKKKRLSGKLVVHIKEVLNLTEEEVILILEVVFMVIVLDVVKKGIDPSSVDPIKMGKVTKMFPFKEMMRVHQVDLRLEKI